MNVADRIDFASRYIRNKEGLPWSLTGREWVRDQFWLPADGFKLWRREGVDPCADCLAHVGDLLEHPADNPTTACACGGLVAEPIIVTILNLQRQDGKTFNTMAFALAQLFRSRGKSIALLCASETQAEALFRENYVPVLEGNPRLAKATSVRRMRMSVERRGNILEVLSTSHKSVTGRSRTHLLIDEARDVDARTAMALIPAVFAMTGVECPAGHVRLSADQAIAAPKTCSACGERLVPWYGRIVITSSSGMLDDSEHDWLAELVDELEKSPHPNYHLFRSEESQNPAKSKKIISAIGDVFGRLPATKHYIEAEIGNRWTRKGEDVVTQAEAKRCGDKALGGITSSAEPGYMFLDTSTTTEKTSIVVLLADSERASPEDPWSHVYVPRIDIWWPGRSGRGAVDEAAVERQFVHVVQMFTGVRRAYIDVRGMPWASRLYFNVRKRGGRFASVVRKWGADADATRGGWALLTRRILERTIRYPDAEELYEELRGVRRRWRRDGQPDVVDRNRDKMHKDITESIALLCWAVGNQQISSGAGMASIVARTRAAAAPAHDQRQASPSARRTFSGDWY